MQGQNDWRGRGKLRACLFEEHRGRSLGLIHLTSHNISRIPHRRLCRVLSVTFPSCAVLQSLNTELTSPGIKRTANESYRVFTKRIDGADISKFAVARAANLLRVRDVQGSDIASNSGYAAFRLSALFVHSQFFSHHYHHHLADMGSGHLLTRSVLTLLTVCLMISPGSFRLLVCTSLLSSVIRYKAFCSHVATNFFCSNLIIKPTRCTNISILFFGIEFYTFRTVPLSIIRSLALYTQQLYVSYML